MLTESRWWRLPLCLAFYAGGMALLTQPATAQDSAVEAEMQRATALDHIVKVTGKRDRVEVTERLAKIVELAERIIRVDGFDPEIIEVKALSPNRIRVQALMQGVTTLVLTDVNDQTHIVQIFVNGDARHLQAVIDNRFPDSAIEAYKIQDSVALTGWVSQPEHITQIVEIAEQFYPRVLNHMQVGGVQQVKLNVKITEVQRSKLRRLGMNFLRSNTPGAALGVPNAGDGFLQLAPSVGGVNPASVAFQMVGGSSTLFGLIDALKEEELLKILAEPTLVTTNGRPAVMLSGGEFPIVVPQTLGTVSIEWREFGVRMEAVPVILGAGRLRLEVMPEVSERDFANALTINGTTVPALTQRKVNTQVEMRFGQTLMLAGLLSTRQTAETRKIPVLGELPWAGAIFRSVRYEDVETELVIMITPQLVAPIEAHQMPAGGPGMFTTFPTDRELFLDGYLEIPNYGDPCSSCGGMGACGAGCPNYSAQPQINMLPIQEQTVPVTRADNETKVSAASALGDRPTGRSNSDSKERPATDRSGLPQTRLGVATQVGYQEAGGGARQRATQSSFIKPRSDNQQTGRETVNPARTTRPTGRSASGLPGLIEP